MKRQVTRCALCGGVIRGFGTATGDSHGMALVGGVLKPVHRPTCPKQEQEKVG